MRTYLLVEAPGLRHMKENEAGYILGCLGDEWMIHLTPFLTEDDYGIVYYHDHAAGRIAFMLPLDLSGKQDDIQEYLQGGWSPEERLFEQSWRLCSITEEAYEDVIRAHPVLMGRCSNPACPHHGSDETPLEGRMSPDGKTFTCCCGRTIPVSIIRVTTVPQPSALYARLQASPVLATKP